MRPLRLLIVMSECEKEGARERRVYARDGSVTRANRGCTETSAPTKVCLGRQSSNMHPTQLKSALSVALTSITPTPRFPATWPTFAAWVVVYRVLCFVVSEACGPLGNTAECGLSELQLAACLRVGLRGCEGAKEADARFLFSDQDRLRGFRQPLAGMGNEATTSPSRLGSWHLITYWQLETTTASIFSAQKSGCI